MALAPRRPLSPFAVRSPGRAKRNPGRPRHAGRIPDVAALQPGYILQLDLAVEALDQRAPLWIELVPVDGADLVEIVLGFGDRHRDRAFYIHFRVCANHIISRR